MDRKKLRSLIQKINFSPQQRTELFWELTLHEQALIARNLAKHILKSILRALSDEKLIEFVEYIESDEAVDYIQLLSPKSQKKIVDLLRDDLKQTITHLLSFDPQTAAGLMNLDYIQVSPDANVEDVAKKFKLHERRTGKSPSIIVSDNDRLVGHLPGHELGFMNKSEKIKKYIKHIPYVRYNASHDEVIDVFHTNPHSKIVVLGENKNILGIIYTDDVLHILEEDESASLYDFAGISDEEAVTDSFRKKVNFRYKWLIINLGTAFLASSVVQLFNDTIAKNVLLAVYMPIVAGMGGNSATQTLAVLVRGISQNQIDLKSSLSTLRNELMSGFINGVINGAIVASVVMIVNRNLLVAMILGIAMVTNLVVASFFGTVIPLIMKQIGKDPASSATIFITTATDVLGFFVFLGLAAILL